MTLTSTDLLVLLLSFAAVLIAGFACKSGIAASRDYLEAGRSLPSGLAAIAIFSAGLGGPALIGFGTLGARFGLQAANILGLASLPAMLLAGLFLAPRFHGSKARTLPEFLGIRFGATVRTLGACLFAAMSVLTSGISLYLVSRVLRDLHVFDAIFRGYGFAPSAALPFFIALCASVVLGSVLLGGLRASAWSHVIQAALLFAGLLPVVFLGLRNIGGWSGLKAALPEANLHLWSGLTTPAGFGLAGLCLAVLLGACCWATDFRTMQFVMAAKSTDAARRAPLLAAIPILLIAFLLVLPGMIAIGLPTPRTTTSMREENGVIYHNTTVVRPEAEAGDGLVPAKVDPATGKLVLSPAGQPALDYDMATPKMLPAFLPSGLLGLGLAAILACLMSGIAASLTAFNTVVTADIFQARIRHNADDRHSLRFARLAAVAATIAAVAVAFSATHFDVWAALILVVSLVNVPLFAVILLGIVWKRATNTGALAGLIAGPVAGLLHHAVTLPSGAQRGMHGAWLTVLHTWPNRMEQDLGTAACVLFATLAATIAVSCATEPRAHTSGLILMRKKLLWWKRPETLAAAILLAFLALNLIFA